MDVVFNLFFNECLVYLAILVFSLDILLASQFGMDGIELLTEGWAKKDRIPSDKPEKSQFSHHPYTVSVLQKPVQVKNAIRRFGQSARYQHKIDHQNELYNWLNREFPIQFEAQTGTSRADLILRNTTIKTNKPTGSSRLDTFSTKFLNYSHHYPYFIVLSENNFHELHTLKGER
jgi:hypothetical protein